MGIKCILKFEVRNGSMDIGYILKFNIENGMMTIKIF